MLVDGLCLQFGLNVYEMINRTYALTVQVHHFHGSIIKAKLTERRRQHSVSVPIHGECGCMCVTLVICECACVP